MSFSRFLLILIITSSFKSHSATSASLERFYISSFIYEDYLYSTSKKTEIGDSAEIDFNIDYNFSENTNLQLGLQTYPEDNRFNNKTSKIEVLINHQLDNLKLGLDGEVQTNESSTGGTSVGFDLDSEKTNIAYGSSDTILTFYPFNFDGEVGDEFSTWDITRIYYIEGSPTSIGATPGTNDKIASKTIPGFSVSHKTGVFNVILGLGQASFLYPSNSDFNLVNNQSATSWERKETVAYRVGLELNSGPLLLKLKYISQDKTQQTGALIQKAASLIADVNINQSQLLFETVYSKAGYAPWNLSRSTSWFAQTTPFQPVYADNYNVIQDWVGKSDFAISVKYLYKFEKVSPFLVYRYLGSNFIYRERDSAHLLRTADDSKSHGGLSKIGAGIEFVKGDFKIIPEFEYLKAQNAVFTSSGDIRSNRLLSTFKKKDYVLSLTVNYELDGEVRK